MSTSVVLYHEICRKCRSAMQKADEYNSTNLSVNKAYQLVALKGKEEEHVFKEKGNIFVRVSCPRCSH